MTAEEALVRCKELYMLLASHFSSEEVKPLGMAIEALERVGKADKYRWHDLRKDPDDLPEEGITVNIMYGKNKKYDSAKLDRTPFNLDQHWTNCLCCFNDVVSWKYIEPFEEAEL